LPDSDFPQADSLKEQNLEITFENEALACQAVDSLKKADLGAVVTIDAEEDQRAVLRAEMRDELNASMMGPGPAGALTKAQNKGVVKWVLIFAPAGALLLFIVGLLVWPSPTGLIATAAIGATGGATLGFVIGGFLGPREHDEGRPEAESGKVVGIHSRNAGDIEKAMRVLREFDVVRIDRVDGAGRPMGPASKDTRPLRGETPT
jgi:hypothetical protein